MKKVLALILAIVTVGAALVSCSSDTSDTADVTDAADTTAETTTEDPGPKPDLPDTDLNGYEFRILYRDNDHHKVEVYSEEMNGDVVNDAVYERNNAVEQKYNTKIVPLTVDESDEAVPQTRFRTEVQSGDSTFDLALLHASYGANLALEGVAYNWNDVEYIDMSQPWWNHNIVEEFDIEGNLFIAMSDLCNTTIGWTWGMVYNYQMAADYDIPEIFPMVKDGTWVYDTFAEMTKIVLEDLNGDGIYDMNDKYGYTTHWNSSNSNWTFAADIEYIGKDADGNLYLLPMPEKAVTLVEKLYSLIYENKTTFQVTSNIQNETNTSKIFSDNRALFAAVTLNSGENLRAMELDYGIIPYPKYNEAQEKYYTHVDGHAPIMILPKTLKDTESFGIVMEAISYEGYKRVIPALKEILLAEKYARDDNSREMIQLILDGRVYKLFQLYDFNGVGASIRNLIWWSSRDFASHFASIEEKAATLVEDLAM
nr:hypothetical protein [Clostridia bacterium]